MRPREESNPYLSLRTGLLYPLSYEGYSVYSTSNQRMKQDFLIFRNDTLSRIESLVIQFRHSKRKEG
jgi:hypothetical protein